MAASTKVTRPSRLAATLLNNLVYHATATVDDYYRSFNGDGEVTVADLIMIAEAWAWRLATTAGTACSICASTAASTSRM